MIDFDGKVALVTGGASGIGAAIVRRLAAAGAKVVVADVNEDGAQALQQELGQHVRAFRVDVADAASVQAMIDFARDTFGGLHLAVNNAGVSPTGPIPTADLQTEDWDRLIAINQSSSVLLHEV
ncbi:SDR family NAD(P)-dependent oxidoreductase [Sphingobium sp.]|uniref:SDR family NAD(P)-dependent oxidoreductase n=1 Tax=Sphingobium sp. TaxID=1912891 RepID=UPI00257BEE8B|nr:SDR family NAD(P)-dependent oxidoreductase [Sphingobium sp.]